MCMAFCWGALAIVLGVLIGAEVASGSRVPIRGPDLAPVAGPLIAASDIVWIERVAGGGVVVKAMASNAHTPRTVLHRDPPVAHRLDPLMAAAPGRLAIELDLAGTTPSTGRSTAGSFTGPLDGPFEELPLCLPSQLLDLAVTESAVAYHSRTEGACRQFVVRDLATPPAHPPRELDRDAFALRLAGRYVAWLERAGSVGFSPDLSDIVVYDRIEDRELYRVDHRMLPAPGVIVGLDLQTDGKVAFVSYRAQQTRRGLINSGLVGWASAAEPRPHILGLPARRHYEVRIAGDTIAFLGSNTTRSFEPRAPIVDGELGLADLSGRSRIHRRPVESSVFAETFDFDGERLTWAELTCKGMVLRSAPARRVVPRRALRCPLTFSTPPRVRSSGVVSFVLDCRGLSRACGAERVIFESRGRRVATSRPRRGGLLRRAHTARLSSAARLKLRSRGALRLEARAAIRDSDGRVQRRRGTIVLRSAR